MTTQTFTPHPIMAALLQASHSLGAVQWSANTSLQEYFIKLYNSNLDDIEHFSDTELRSWASESARELNKILSNEGFDIQLDELQNNEIGVVSILDILLKWLKIGQELPINGHDEHKYPGVKIKSEFVENRSTFLAGINSKEYTQQIAILNTTNGDVVYMTIADKGELKGFELLEHILSIKKNIEPDIRPKFVHFPMIDLNHQPDISWLIGLPHSGGGYITQALQQTKFKMNHEGAHLKSAVAIAVMRSLSPQIESGIIINTPFYLWIERPSVKLPIICAYMDYDVWKDPSSLDM
jgi:hypothetical protein